MWILNIQCQGGTQSCVLQSATFKLAFHTRHHKAQKCSHLDKLLFRSASVEVQMPGGSQSPLTQELA